MSASLRRINLVFAYNVRTNQYRQFGNTFFKPIQAAFEKSGVQCHLLPIETVADSSIEERAKRIEAKVERVKSKLPQNSVIHAVAYSVSGIDFKYFISKLSGNKMVSSLTTIGSPHKGSFLAKAFARRELTGEYVEPLMRLVGIPPSSFCELEHPLKTTVPQGFPLFSIGGEKESVLTSESLRFTQNFIQENRVKNFITDNDGIFTSDEAEVPKEEGNHLVTFHADHSDLVGLSRMKSNAIFKFVADHLLNIGSQSAK